MKSARRLTVLSLLCWCSAALADEQQDNLRGLTGPDLCPPSAYVYVDDNEDSALSSKLDEALDRYATLYSIPYGDPKTCTVTQSLVVDTFKSSGKYVYSIKFLLELRRSVTVALPYPSVGSATAIPSIPGPAAHARTLDVKYLQVWHDQGFGLISDSKNIPDVSLEQLRNYYEAFALAWKATHRK